MCWTRRDRRGEVPGLGHPRPLPGVRRKGRPCPAEGPGAVRTGRLLCGLRGRRGSALCLDCLIHVEVLLDITVNPFFCVHNTNANCA